MNITPVQNNSQSFGMAFKLKGDGAKKLAAFLEETNSATNKYVMEELIKPIHDLKTEVVYDGADILIGKATVSPRMPIELGKDYRDLQYILNGGSNFYRIKYDKPQKYGDLLNGNSFLQQLFNAKEIAKDMDRVAAQKAYEAQQAAVKQVRIEKAAKKLQDLYG